MLTIAIDSSQDICALALGRDSQLLSEYHFYHKMSLLRRMLPTVEQMLSDLDAKPSDLDGIIVSLGPGSFTGLRIGVTIAKTLAYTLSKPIVGVGTLDAIARGVAPSNTEFICPMIHARATEVYWSLFDSSGEMRLEDYAASPLSAVLDSVASRGESVYFCGTGATRNAEAIRHKFGAGAPVCKPWSDFARGAALLEAGNHRLREGLIDDPLTLAPMYVKKPTPVVRLESGEFEKSKA